MDCSAPVIKIDSGTVQSLHQDETRNERYSEIPDNSEDDIQDNVMEMTPLAQSNNAAGQLCHHIIITP